MRPRRRTSAKTAGHTRLADCWFGRCQCQAAVQEAAEGATEDVAIEEGGDDQHVVMGSILMPDVLPAVDPETIAPGFAEPSGAMAMAPLGWGLSACRADRVHNFKTPDLVALTFVAARLTIDCNDGELFHETCNGPCPKQHTTRLLMGLPAKGHSHPGPD